MENKLSNLIQYISLILFVLIAIFLSIGEIKIQMDIYTLLEGGPSGNLVVTLDYVWIGKIIVTIVVILEAIMYYCRKVRLSTLSIILNILRIVPITICAFFDILMLFGRRGTVDPIYMTVFGYLLLTMGMLSLIGHARRRKHLKKLMCLENEISN